VLEAQDFTIMNNCSNDGSPSCSSSSKDDYPGYDTGRGLLHPWPQLYRLATDSDEVGNPLSSLPRHGGGASWSLSPSPSAPQWHTMGLGGGALGTSCASLAAP
jgi:hypothetical protein